MNDERLDEIERQIHDAIRFHREQYERAIRPLMERLTQIRSLRPQSLLLSQDQIDALATVAFDLPVSRGEGGSNG